MTETTVEEKFVSAYDTYNQQLVQLYKTEPHARESEPSSVADGEDTVQPCVNRYRGLRYVVSTALIACTVAMVFFARSDRSDRYRRSGR